MGVEGEGEGSRERDRKRESREIQLMKKREPDMKRREG